MDAPFSLAFLQAQLSYNYWARDRQLTVCATLSPEQFDRPLGGSHASLRDTLAHLIGVEWIWLERWLGRSPRRLPGADAYPTLAVLVERWTEVERDMRAFCAGLNQAALARSVTYVNFRGESWTYLQWQMLVHLLAHQSYHRGQVATLLRQLGAQPPAVDFLIAQDEGLCS